MTIEIKEHQKPKGKKRAAKKPIVQKTHPFTTAITEELIDSIVENKTTLIKSSKNPEFESFEDMVSETRKAIRKAVDYRHSVKDDGEVIIKKVTSEAIKKIWRSSRWA